MRVAPPQKSIFIRRVFCALLVALAIGRIISAPTTAHADIASKAYTENTYLTKSAAANYVTNSQLNSAVSSATSNFVTKAQLDAAILNSVTQSVNARQCNVTNGNGAQLYSPESGWGTCIVASCNKNYYASNAATCSTCPENATCAGGMDDPVCNDGEQLTPSAYCAPTHAVSLFEDLPQIYTYGARQYYKWYGYPATYYNRSISYTDYFASLQSQGIHPTYYIQATCSNTSGIRGVGSVNNYITLTNGQYCWCRLKRVSDNVPGNWAFDMEWSSSDCPSYCATYCARDIASNESVRRGVLSSF